MVWKDPPSCNGLSAAAALPSSHTAGHYQCPACEAIKAAAMQSLTGLLVFEEAIDCFLAMKCVHRTGVVAAAQYVRLNTEKGYRRNATSLGLFFAGMRLTEIHWWHMRGYQQARVIGDPPFIRPRRPGATPGPCPCKPAQVNQELGFLKRLKVLTGCWTMDDQKYYAELQEEESDAQRALSPEQQAGWLDVARSRERWEIIYWYSLVAFDTLCSTNELRGLRIGDILLRDRKMNVPWPASKNRFRHREIVLENQECLWALDKLLERAHGLGAREPQHYLFPWRDTRANCYLPQKHMTESGIKKLWQEVRDASTLTWFRLYDTRHTGATRFAESGVPPDIIVKRLGHASDRMRQHYTHIFESAQRYWMRQPPRREVEPYRSPLRFETPVQRAW